MKRFWLIFSGILTISTLLFAYGWRFIGRLTFDVDLVLQLYSITSDSFVTPLRIEVDNKNSKSLTVTNLNISIYSENNVLLAETNTPINSYKILGYRNNKFNHDFKVYLTAELIKIIKDQTQGRKTDIYLISNFDIFGIIPISVREELEF